MNRLFSPVKKILCPYDLTEIRYRNEIKTCPNCNAELPVQYMAEYSEALPFFTQIVGWSRVGKTVYLQALTQRLMQMGKVWRNKFAFAPLTAPTLKYVRDVRAFWDTGEMPAPTQLELNEAYIMLLTGMERWGGRTMVLRDVAGEAFNSFEFQVKYTPYLLHVPTTMLMISIDDIHKDPSKAMDDLMNSYIETMMKHDKEKTFRRERRNMVVVFSKADLIFEDLPANLQNYILEDPFLKAVTAPTASNLDAGKMAEYMEQLRHASGAIRDWISNDPAGQALINRAEHVNIHLEFTLTSSTGRRPKDGSVPIQLEPYRVLDPFFWALEFQSR